MMLKNPDLKDEEIIAFLADVYGLNVEMITFLPVGADFNTAVYRVVTNKGSEYFLKVRSGEFLEASVLVPKYLADLNVKQVIPPLVTKTGQLWANLSFFKAILYPYIHGHNGVEAKLSEDHWIQFGATMKKFHSADIPSNVTKGISQETFSSKWRDVVKAFLVRIENEIFEESTAIETAKFLKSKSAEIVKIIERTEKLVRTLQTQLLEYVLCHADIHGWNLIVDQAAALYIVDWDTLIFAPKERDLMFIGAGIWDSGRTLVEEELLFYQGYGQTKVNQDAICYYRFERIIQDIGEYCEHIFLSNEDDDRAQSLEYLRSNFLPSGTIEKAYASDNMRRIL